MVGRRGRGNFGSGSGVYLYKNDSKSWEEVNTGLGHGLIRSPALGDRYLYAATYGGSVWRRPLAELTGVEEGGGAEP